MIRQVPVNTPLFDESDVAAVSQALRDGWIYGEGGMVVTDDDSLAQKIRYHRNLTFQPQKRFVHNELGWNFRMSSLQCALGASQLTRIGQILESRRALGARYQEEFADIMDIKLPLPKTEFSISKIPKSHL